MSNDTIRGLKNKAHTTAESESAGPRDRDTTDSSTESSQKTRSRCHASAQTGGCSHPSPRPVDTDASRPENAAGTEKRLVTDGGRVGTWCSHPRVRRYGRTDARGEAVIEERCTLCGATVSMSGGGR